MMQPKYGRKERVRVLSEREPTHPIGLIEGIQQEPPYPAEPTDWLYKVGWQHQGAIIMAVHRWFRESELEPTE